MDANGATTDACEAEDEARSRPRSGRARLVGVGMASIRSSVRLVTSRWRDKRAWRAEATPSSTSRRFMRAGSASPRHAWRLEALGTWPCARPSGRLMAGRPTAQQEAAEEVWPPTPRPATDKRVPEPSRRDALTPKDVHTAWHRAASGSRTAESSSTLDSAVSPRWLVQPTFATDAEDRRAARNSPPGPRTTSGSLEPPDGSTDRPVPGTDADPERSPERGPVWRSA